MKTCTTPDLHHVTCTTRTYPMRKEQMTMPQTMPTTKTKATFVALTMTLGLALASCSQEDDPAATTPTATSEATSETTTEDAEETTGDMAPTTTEGDDQETTSVGDDTQMTSEGDGTEMTGDDSEMTSEGAMGNYAPGACTTFFTEGGPLADRAESTREAIEAGTIVDTIALDAVSLLEARIGELAADAEPDVAPLLEEVNAPFTEVVDSSTSEEVVNAETGEVTLPEIDVQASADAQAELESVCQG